eukprot:Protomagalhaensia_wolfi_Nauph_80__770@NODE_1442_length_1528_cov_58_606447_g1115_i0_p1_GENE_NODE_1442_length_1528_cov_58_606447_g1115_i0NODE_1442_length_1528_cov_58_606447_g1115_i0_p1_ORF_typecomplete_len413_score86_58Integrin_beta/PF00362_18/4_1e08VWA_2/PF13519_6/0_081_NODE_1442_length_1528_cov_58_606447_g1115_i0521290
MRLCGLSAFLAVGLAVDESAFLSIDTVYGAHDFTRKILSRRALRARKLLKSQLLLNEEFLSSRAPTNCSFPLSIHFLVDDTAGMAEKKPQLVSAIRALDDFFVNHTGSSYALSLFRDKPVEHLGESDDFCINTLVESGSSLDEVADAYSAAPTPAGGGDSRNNHFGAVTNLLEPTKDWIRDSSQSHLILLLTDTPPHFAEDGGETYYSSLAPVTELTHTDPETCSEYYYPKPRMLQDGLDSTNSYLGVLVVENQARKTETYKAFEWLNAYMGQRSDMVAGAKPTEEALVRKMKRVLNGLEHSICGTKREVKKTEANTQASAEVSVKQSSGRLAGRSRSRLTNVFNSEDSCEVPSEDQCLECITQMGCCEESSLRVPKLLVVLNAKPQELQISGRFTSDSNPMVVDLSSYSKM